jgi:hypothetical protein
LSRKESKIGGEETPENPPASPCIASAASVRHNRDTSSPARRFFSETCLFTSSWISSSSSLPLSALTGSTILGNPSTTSKDGDSKRLDFPSAQGMY